MKNTKRTFTAQELYAFIKSYKLACFHAPCSGNAWFHMNVQTEMFTLVNSEDYSIIKYKLNPPGCVDGGITLAGNAFTFNYKDYGWSAEGVLSSDEIKGKIALAIYQRTQC